MNDRLTRFGIESGQSRKLIHTLNSPCGIPKEQESTKRKLFL
jgi:hypothetical protein